MTKLTAKNWRKEWLKRFKGSSCKHCPKDSLDFIQSILQAQAKDLAGEETLDAWCSAIHYSELGKGKLDKKVMVNHYNQHRQEVLERGKKWIETKH